MKNTEILNTTFIESTYENITKKDLLQQFEEALNKFTSSEILHSISLRAIVRVEDKTYSIDHQ